MTDAKQFSHRNRIRGFWHSIIDKFKDKTNGKFPIDTRHFDREEMILFPDIAYQTLNNDSVWRIIVHGWRYAGNRNKTRFGLSPSRWIERLTSQLIEGVDMSYLNRSIDRDRLKPFFVENEPHDLVKVIINDNTYTFQTDQNGQFYEEFEVSSDDIQRLKQKQGTTDMLVYEATGDINDRVNGCIRLIEPRQGISVISDIDDTIKISEVLDKVRLLANTFIHPFKAVPGMAELYRKWYAQNKNCTFHYLSGMPDQLYTLTNEFINQNNFPDGSFHMRHFGWAAMSIFKFLHSKSTFVHKVRNLRYFLSNTMRDYVLVGDSGEKDPEIYGTVAREYPERIRAIFIRAIKDEGFDDQRFLDAFQNVPREKWQIFNDPQQLPIDLSRSPRAT